MDKKRGGLLSRLAVFALTLVCALGIAVPALAAAPKASITVTGIDTTTDANATTTAYRLTDAVYSDDGSTFYGYAWDQNVKAWVDKNYPAYSDASKFNDTVPSEDLKVFYDKLAAAVKSGSVKLTAAGTTTGNGTIDNLAVGNYLLITEGGQYIYAPAAGSVTPGDNGTAKGSSVAVKAKKPGFDKTVNEDTQIVGTQYGDTVNYDLRADVPSFPDNAIAKNFQIGDKLSEGLDLKADSVTVYGIGADGGETALKSGTDYTLVTNAAADHEGNALSFLVKLNYDQVKGYVRIHVDYDAAVNAQAVVGPAGNPNDAKIEYSNNPYDANSWNEIPVEKKVYSYALDITKVDAANESKHLAGAEFTVAKKPAAGQKAQEIAFVKESDGVYHVAAAGEANTTTTVAVSATEGSEGTLVLKGLGADTYQITETKAPANYNKPSDPFEVTIADANGDGKVDDGGDDNGHLAYAIKNTQGFQLPKTGGIGTVLFTAVGIVLVAGGVVLLVRRGHGNER